MRGLPARADVAPATLIEPYSLLWGAFMVAGFAAHGAAFAAVRVPDTAAPSARLFRRRVDHTSAVLY
jgi:cytochrome bd-type quinol oxidase subunit 2